MSWLPSRPGASGLHRGRRWIVAFALVALGALIATLVHLERSLGGGDSEPAPPAAVESDWRLIPALRGRILDRTGKPLADNRPTFDLYLAPRRFTAGARARLIDLLQLRDDEVARLDRRLADWTDDAPGRAILVLEDQGRERADLVSAAELDLAGAVEVHAVPRRRYPQGELAAHLIGYVDHPGAARSALERPGYDAEEMVGRRGVEQALERFLHGTAGIDQARRELPVPGDDVVLTIDLGLQRMVTEALSRHRAGAAAVVEVETGRVLALVSNPSFDPGVMSDPLAQGERAGLEADPRTPLLDRTLDVAYPPGSTWKLVTAVAGLESGLVSPRDELTCTGERMVGRYRLRDMHAHGTVDFLEALAVSCNVYFWQVAERTGIDSMAAVARDFGFGEPTGLGINGDAAGTVPDSGTYGGSNSLVRTLDTAIGGGDVRLTVIQLAMAYAAVANGGTLYAPQVVRRVLSASGQVVEERPPLVRRRLEVSAATVALVREGLWRVVNARGGTAFAARSGAVRMVGKTGTAPVVNNDPNTAHALFVGWAPSDRPQIAFAVLIERGGIGGAVAAPVARTIVDDYFTKVPRGRRRTRSR